MKKALIVCGATATGKTALAAAVAKKLHTEVISADSMLIYKKLCIGTAKPSEEEMLGVKHHLIDVAEPTENFSVNDYENLALPLCEQLLKEDKTPVICGGTGFYINALLYKSKFGNAGASEEIRKKYEEITEKNGKKYLHDLLKKIDPLSAEKLHENDVKRVIRALEIYELTGKRKSEQCDQPIPRFPFVSVCIDYPREELYQRINLRVDKMFEAGLKEEVIRLLQSGVKENAQCMQGIGYKEIAAGLRQNKTDEEIKEEIKQATRNYAKRQITFFKRMENIVFLPKDRCGAEEVIKLL